MKYTVTDKDLLIRLFLFVFRIRTRAAIPIITTFYKWLENYGPEWTVERLKSLKTSFLQHYAGNTAFRSDDTCIGWHSDGSPKGCFHYLWTLTDSQAMVDKCLGVLMMYSSVVMVGDPTRKQKQKFLAAVREPRISGDLPPWSIEEEMGTLLYTRCWRKVTYDIPSNWITSESKRVLSFDENVGFQKKKESDLPLDKHIADFLLMANPLLIDRLVRQLVSHVFHNPMIFHYKDALQKLSSKTRHASLLESCAADPVVGHIGLIQERGCKLRAVANPLRVIQITLSRLKNTLELAAQSLPWDCTFNQEKGLIWAKRKLDEGHILFAFDLSNASDTIPLDDQIEMLSHVGPKRDWEWEAALALFYEVSRSRWLLPKSMYRYGKNKREPAKTRLTLPEAYPMQQIEFLRWVKGQGLGIGCSFGAFAQTHGHRLRALEILRGVSDSFVVLGDDVIVTADIAADYYDFVVRRWGCDISAAKTLTSNTLSEFASRVISKKYNYKTYKYPSNPKLFDTRDPIGLLCKFGSKALKVVPSRFRPMVQLIAGLPKPLGLGWRWPESEYLLPNPKGSENILMPNKREQVPDILPFTKERKRGAHYDSVVVRTKSLVERKQDLDVAFQTQHSNPSIELASCLSKSDFKPNLLAEVSGLAGEIQPDQNTSPMGQSALGLEMQILHVNTSLSDESETLDTLHDITMEDSTYFGVNQRRDALSNEHRGPSGLVGLNSLVNPISIFEKKTELWYYTMIIEIVFLFWAIKLGIWKDREINVPRISFKNSLNTTTIHL